MSNYLNPQPTLPNATQTSVFNLIVQTDDLAAARMVPFAGESVLPLTKFERFFMRSAKGAHDTNVHMQSGLGYATGTATINALTASQTVTFGGKAFTAQLTNAGNVGTYFLLGSTNSSVVTNLSTAVNAYPATAQLIQTTNCGSGILGICAQVPGVVGNFITMATNASAGSQVVLSGATLTGATQFSEGVVAKGL